MKKTKYAKIAKYLHIFAHIWSALLALLILVYIIRIWFNAGSFLEGWNTINETFNPYGIINFLLILILASPAIFATYLSDKFEKKALNEN